jgi:hypothetical protein
VLPMIVRRPRSGNPELVRAFAALEWPLRKGG